MERLYALAYQGADQPRVLLQRAPAAPQRRAAGEPSRIARMRRRLRYGDRRNRDARIPEPEARPRHVHRGGHEQHVVHAMALRQASREERVVAGVAAVLLSSSAEDGTPSRCIPRAMPSASVWRPPRPPERITSG